MKVEKSEDGTWRVVDEDGNVIAHGLSNSGAWDILDSYEGPTLREQAWFQPKRGL